VAPGPGGRGRRRGGGAGGADNLKPRPDSESDSDRDATTGGALQSSGCEWAAALAAAALSDEAVLVKY